jgi:hypothetical protein
VNVNLGRTDCRFCSREVLLDEEPRRLTSNETALLLESQFGHLHRALVANATCSECSAEYVAWFETDTLCSLYSTTNFPLSATSFFRDLSHRSTMSDVPGEPDLPMYVIDHAPVRRTWPTCLECGKRIFGNFGCQCPQPKPLWIVVKPFAIVPEWRKMPEMGEAITIYDLFHFSETGPLDHIDGDEGEWASLRTLLEISYLESLTNEVQTTLNDLREHWIEVMLPPVGPRAYSGDDRNYHKTIEDIVNRAGLVVEADPFGIKGVEALELTPETPIDGGAGPWVDPKSRYILQPHRKEDHWLAAYCWAYSKLPHHWIHIMQEEVEAFRRHATGTEGGSVHWWASLEDLKLVRPIAHCERDLPLGLQVDGLFIVDGDAFVAEDKREPRQFSPASEDDMDGSPVAPSDSTYDGAFLNWPPPTVIGQYPNPPISPPMSNVVEPKHQFPNFTIEESKPNACGHPDCRVWSRRKKNGSEELTFGRGELVNGYWEIPCSVCEEAFKREQDADNTTNTKTRDIHQQEEVST